MQENYKQSAPIITYDFSKENIALISQTLSAKESIEIITPVELEDSERTNYQNESWHKDYPDYLHQMATYAQSNTKRSKANARDSALWTAGGYVGIAGMLVIGALTKHAAFFLLAKGPAILFAKASDYTDSWNLAFQGSYELYKDSRDYKKKSHNFDRALFIANGQNINECLYPKETLKWAENFKSKKTTLVFK